MILLIADIAMSPILSSLLHSRYLFRGEERCVTTPDSQEPENLKFRIETLLRDS